MNEPREETITEATCDWLEAYHWQIVAVHHPGTQGGFRLRGAGGREIGDVVPDIVATRGAAVLIVESKPAFSPADCQKVLLIAENAEYRVQIAGLRPDASGGPHLLVGLAFAGPLPPSIHPEVIVFHHDGNSIAPLRYWDADWHELEDLEHA